MPTSFKDQLKNLTDVNLDKAKQRVDKILGQAKDSLRVLDSLQKEGISLAKSFIEIPVASRTKKFTDEKIVKNLGKIGLATREEVRALEKKIENLASELHTQIDKTRKKSGKTDVSE
ncbi:MAG: hypothetical protein HYW49_13560 [Deltaproteobacteria bacterium]|nr:hypothetical protein [Deltaproteobacteria bacterium]